MRTRERGVILMSALILVALAAIVATSLFFDTALAARRAAASFSMEQAVQLGAGGEALAAFAIAEDSRKKASAAAGGIKAGKPLGTVSVTSVPTSVEVLPGGTLEFVANPQFAIKLGPHCVNATIPDPLASSRSLRRPSPC